MKRNRSTAATAAKAEEQRKALQFAAWMFLALTIAVSILALSAGSALAGPSTAPTLPTGGLLGLLAAAVIGGIFLARRKR